jgi:hypothetical protein
MPGYQAFDLCFGCACVCLFDCLFVSMNVNRVVSLNETCQDTRLSTCVLGVRLFVCVSVSVRMNVTEYYCSAKRASIADFLYVVCIGIHVYVFTYVCACIPTSTCHILKKQTLQPI